MLREFRLRPVAPVVANMEQKPAGVGDDAERPMPESPRVVIESGPALVDHRHKFQEKVGGHPCAKFYG